MGLKLYFPFDNDLNDIASGYAIVNHGAVLKQGIIGNQVYFETSTNYLEITNIQFGETVTITYWGKAASFGTKMQFSFDSSNYGAGPDLFFDSGEIYWNTGDGGDNPFVKDGVNTSTPSTDDWHHYQIVNDQQSNKTDLYIDGQYVGTAGYRNTAQTSEHYFIIGNYSSSKNYAWDGYLDELRIYDHQLTAQEIYDLCNKTIITDYGLVYNTAANLCVTIKEGEVPFQDVKSIQVEEKTTNHANLDISSWSIFSGIDQKIQVEIDSPVNQPVYKITSDDTSGEHAVLGSATSVDSGDYRTATVYLKAGEYKKAILAFQTWQDWTGGDGQATIFDLANGTAEWFGEDAKGHDITYVGDGWYKCWIKAKNTNADTTSKGFYIYLIDDNGNKDFLGETSKGIYASAPQDEVKKFPTSFVKGERFPYGTMTISTKLEENNFVISFWFKPDWNWGDYVRAEASEQSYNIITYGSPGSDGFLFRILSNGVLNLQSYPNTDSPTLTASSADLSKTEWAHFVIVNDESNKLKLYINGELVQTHDNANYVHSSEQKLFIGSRKNDYANYGPANGLFADIFIGKAKNSQGNLIWTKDFIRKVYQSKKPFQL